MIGTKNSFIIGIIAAVRSARRDRIAIWFILIFSFFPELVGSDKTCEVEFESAVLLVVSDFWIVSVSIKHPCLM